MAIVVASDRYVAEDAAVLVDVEYEPLDAAVDTTAAARTDAPLLFESAGSNVTLDYVVEYGDVEAAFAAADLVVSDSFRTNRHSGVPMETRGLVASFEDGTLTVWGPTKVLHANRRTLWTCSVYPWRGSGSSSRPSAAASAFAASSTPRI